MTLSAQAQDGRLLPRAAWRASSSSIQVKAQAIACLIGGDAIFRAGTAVRVARPSRTRPAQVRTHGRRIDTYAAAGVALSKPFRTLEARW